MRTTTTRPSPRRPGSHAIQGGFSLVELLVASALSLLVMAAVASLFSDFSRTVSDSRSMVDLNSRMRNAAWRLRQDLAGLTCSPAPLVRPESGEGYFHVIEGPANSFGTTIVGDIDDVLAMTTSNPAAPFTGQLDGATGFESPTAEAIWFCDRSGDTYKGEDLYNLYRRQLLVSPTPEAGAYAGNVFAPQGTSDLSYGTYVNSLGDLSKTGAAPALAPNRFLTKSAGNLKLTGNRTGEDVMLTNVIGFDVRLVPATATAATDQTFETREDGAPRVEGNLATYPLRGIDVRIRSIEPSTGQIRELKVVHSFPAR